MLVFWVSVETETFEDGDLCGEMVSPLYLVSLFKFI